MNQWGGGANTQTGLVFEREVDFHELLRKTPGYEVKAINSEAGKVVYFRGERVATCFRKHDFYRTLAFGHRRAKLGLLREPISGVLTPHPGPLPVKGRGSRGGRTWWFDCSRRGWTPL